MAAFAQRVKAVKWRKVYVRMAAFAQRVKVTVTNVSQAVGGTRWGDTVRRTRSGENREPQTSLYSILKIMRISSLPA